MARDFTIVFEKLDEVYQSELPAIPYAAGQEIDEIAELRRIVLEVTEPEPLSYTTT